MTQTKAVLPPEFTPVYKYTMRNGKVEDPEVLDKKLWRLRCVVYARVCGDEIVYVGKTEGTLCGRILAHKRGISVDQPKASLVESQLTAVRMLRLPLSESAIGTIRAVQCTAGEMTVLEPGQQHPRLGCVPEDTV